MVHQLQNNYSKKYFPQISQIKAQIFSATNFHTNFLCTCDITLRTQR